MNSIKIFPSTIKGKVKISGSKNASLPILAASLLNKKKTILKNIPNIKDINEMLKIFTSIGVKYKRSKNKLVIYPGVNNVNIKHESTRKIRASYYLMGTFLALFNRVKISLPGGCSIGARPIDFHLYAFERLGAVCFVEDDIVEVTIKKKVNNTIELPKKSIGATVNAILLATSIKKQTIIKNVANEPEIMDLVNFLRKFKMNIKYEDECIFINGCEMNKVVKYKVIPDRIEASTFICLGLLSKRIKITNIRKSHLQNIIKPIVENNGKLKVKRKSLIVKKSTLKPFNVISAEYPKLSTDIFPLLIPVLASTNKLCKIKETIFENRFDVCNSLSDLGLNIKVEKNECFIQGYKEKKVFETNATDLRCAASLLIFALSQPNVIVINNIDHIYRGYENILVKLKKINSKFLLIQT